MNLKEKIAIEFDPKTSELIIRKMIFKTIYAFLLIEELTVIIVDIIY